MSSDEDFLHHEPCPSCGSSDALARYGDGHGHCFSCKHFEPAEGQSLKTKRKPMAGNLIEPGEAKPLRKRCIDVETAKKYHYTQTRHNGRMVQCANFWRDGSIIAQKLRLPDKEFEWKGKPKKAGLFGQHLFRDGGRQLVITEGEIDAMSMSQVQGNKWPVVSLPNGAQSAVRDISAELSWVESFDTVILMFDMDTPGQEAAQEVAAILTGTTVKIAHLPLKDANECLVEGNVKALTSAMWEAKEYQPDSLVSVADVLEDALSPVQHGLPFVFDELTRFTYGRRYGECWALGAGTGVGKTEFIMEQVRFDIYELGLHVGVIMLEQKNGETGLRVAGKQHGKQFHVPPDEAGWTDEERRKALTDLADQNLLTMYRSDKEGDWHKISARIKWMALNQGIRVFYLDHLTALVAHAEDEKKALEEIMAELATLCEKLDIWILFVSHLATPHGLPHEEGGRVMIRHFKGSRAIGYWSHFMIGLERAQQSEDAEVKKTTVVRVLKDRYTGRATGEKFGLKLNPENFRLEPAPLPEDTGGPFKKEADSLPEDTDY